MSSFISARSNAPAWARSTRGRRSPSTSLQTAGLASRLLRICASRKRSQDGHTVLTLDVVAKLVVRSPASGRPAAGFLFFLPIDGTSNERGDRGETDGNNLQERPTSGRSVGKGGARARCEAGNARIRGRKACHRG